MPSDTQISMKEEEKEEEASPETQNETTPESKQTFPSFSKLLQGVMAANSSVSSHPFHKDSTFQGQFGMSHQDALASVTAKAEAQDQIQKLQPETSVLALSTTLTHEEKQSSPHNSLTMRVANLEAGDIPKTPNSDGFSWRKYGQKQVKNSGSSRSYYRCTYYNCCAKKKVQHLDISGKIIEVVYKGEHNHDAPTNLKGSNRKRDRDAPLTPQSDCQKEAGQIVVFVSHESHDQTPRVKNEASMLPREAEGCKSSNAKEIGMTDSMKEYDVVPFKKRRIKESGKASSESVYRTFKEPKVVVHAAEDVGSSSDGYRWRKYGQKMVKGNPNPRSYYRCSSSGCPVRKHIEKSTDNSTVVVVTYEGIHDHEKPLPKGSPKPDRPKSPPPGSIEDGGDHKPKGGPDKALESARTLLSIGFELKSC